MNDLRFSDRLGGARKYFELFDDFDWHLSPHLWTNLAASMEGTVAIDADGEGGIVTLDTGDTDNDECALATTNELFIFAANRPIYAEVRLQFTEVTNARSNLAFGFADAIAANLIADDGASVGIPNSGALIYKVDGGTVWRANSENNATATDSVSVMTAGGASYQRLGILVRPVTSALCEITYYLDDEPLRDSNANEIKHNLLVASATQMDFGVYAKNGGVQGTVDVDYIYAIQRRA